MVLVIYQKGGIAYRVNRIFNQILTGDQEFKKILDIYFLKC